MKCLTRFAQNDTGTVQSSRDNTGAPFSFIHLYLCFIGSFRGRGMTHSTLLHTSFPQGLPLLRFVVLNYP